MPALLGSQPSPTTTGWLMSEMTPFEWHIASGGKRNEMQVLVFDSLPAIEKWHVVTCFLDGPGDCDGYYALDAGFQLVVNEKRGSFQTWPPHWRWWLLP